MGVSYHDIGGQNTTFSGYFAKNKKNYSFTLARNRKQKAEMKMRFKAENRDTL